MCDCVYTFLCVHICLCEHMYVYKCSSDRMYVCLCIHVWTSRYVHTCCGGICMCTCMLLWVSLYVHACLCENLCMHTWLYESMYINMHVCVSAYIYTRICEHVYVYMHAYLNVYACAQTKHFKVTLQHEDSMMSGLHHPSQALPTFRSVESSLHGRTPWRDVCCRVPQTLRQTWCLVNLSLSPPSYPPSAPFGRRARWARILGCWSVKNPSLYLLHYLHWPSPSCTKALT